MWCQAFVTRAAKFAGTFVRDYPSARAARLASGWLNPDASNMPLGAIGYWRWDPDDHVAIHVGGGWWMMGSKHVTQRFGGVAGNAGLVHHSQFTHLPFLGWSATNGGNVVPVEAPAPPPLKANQRIVGPKGVNERSAPNTASTVTREFQPGDVLDFKGYVDNGEDVWGDGDTVWLVGAYEGRFFHRSRFTSSSLDGLPRLNVTEPTPDPEPEPERPPVLPIVDVTAEDFEIAKAWLSFEEVPDLDSTLNTNEEARAYYEGKYGGDYRREVVESHVHWWGAVGEQTHDGLVDYLRRTADLGANLVTSEGRVTKMIPLDRVAYTTGARSTKAWTTENDPQLTEGGYKTLGFVHYVVELKNPRLRTEAILRHNEVVNPETGKVFATACSTIDTAKVREYAEMFHDGRLDPATGQPPATSDPEPEPQPEPQPEPEPEPQPQPSTPTNPLAGIIAGIVTLAGIAVAWIIAAIQGLVG
jgi:hypothetical protein